MSVNFSTEDVRFLSELGFLGISRGLPSHAAVVFSFLRSVRPKSEVGYIGGAMALLLEEKVQLADEMLRSGPQSEAVLAFRTVALSRLGDVSLAQELKDDLVAMRANEAILEIALAAAEKK